MPLPDLRTFCVDTDVVPGEIAITFPGGSELCVTLPDAVPPSQDKLIRQMFGQINAALQPLTPIFNVIDAVMAVFEVIKAISTLNPKEIIEAIPNLAEKIAALLKLIPQVSIVALVAGIIEVLILYLRGSREQMVRARQLLVRIMDAETASARPGNIALARILPCARHDLDKLLVWRNESNKPVNRLVGVINAFLTLIGLGRFRIPCLGSAIADPGALDTAVEFVDVLIELLEIIRLAIPIYPNAVLDARTGGSAKGC